MALVRSPARTICRGHVLRRGYRMESGSYWSHMAPRQVTRRTVLRTAALGGAGLAGAALIGCGGGSSGGGTATATKAAGAAAAKPRFGGTLKTVLGADPPGWSVLSAASVTGGMNSMAQDKLLEFAAGPGVDPTSTDLIPGLATALPEQPDGQTYVFKVRQGVKFQNVPPVNGRPLTVEDVKFAIDTIRSTGSFKKDFEAVTSVTAADAQTLVVKTDKPYAPLLVSTVGQYGWPIFPKELIDTKLTDSTTIGTGAYIRAEWQQGNKIVFKKNPDYWNKNLGFLDEIAFLIIPNADGAVAAFNTNQLDLVVSGASTIAIPCETIRAVTNAEVQSFTGSNAFSSFDTTKPPFNDVRVRKAVWLLYNREAEMQAVYCGKSSPTGLLTQARALKPTETHGDLLKRDVKQAKELLAAAGFANGFKADIAWTPQYGAAYAAALELFATALKEGGITLNPISYEYAKWIAEIYRPPFNWSGMCWSSGRGYPEPDQEIRYWLYPGGNTNQSRVNDPALNALIDKQVGQLNVNERWDTLHAIERLEAKNLYYIFKNGSGSTNFYHKNLHDFVGDGHYSYHEFWYAWLDA
ncbi:MAG: ABC transporter substrate-binding protein [Dehalococcoidia bacterium]|nr:ABC transporter substrate-binding protein [Dehalococcoidia bacterium]